MNYMVDKDDDDYNETPLQMAINAQADKCVYFLVEAGVDATAGHKGRTSLHIASKHGISNLDYFRAFVAAGWEVNALDYRHGTALSLVCHVGNMWVSFGSISSCQYGVTLFLYCEEYCQKDNLEV